MLFLLFSNQPGLEESSSRTGFNTYSDKSSLAISSMVPSIAKPLETKPSFTQGSFIETPPTIIKQTLVLAAWVISGKTHKEYRKGLLSSSFLQEEKVQTQITHQSGISGLAGVVFVLM